MLYVLKSPALQRASEGQSVSAGKSVGQTHLIIGHLNQLDDTVGEVQIPLWVSDVVCEVHHRFRSEERIYNHVLNCPGLNE